MLVFLVVEVYPLSPRADGDEGLSFLVACLEESHLGPQYHTLGELVGLDIELA